MAYEEIEYCIQITLEDNSFTGDVSFELSAASCLLYNH